MTPIFESDVKKFVIEILEKQGRYDVYYGRYEMRESYNK